MTETKEKWYARTVFSVNSIEASLEHYCEKLGFMQSWKYEESGTCIVTQVNRGEHELILAANLDNVGAGRIFISLTEDELKQLQYEIDEKEISVEHIHWGYSLIQIQDSDGNKLLFPVET